MLHIFGPELTPPKTGWSTQLRAGKYGSSTQKWKSLFLKKKVVIVFRSVCSWYPVFKWGPFSLLQADYWQFAPTKIPVHWCFTPNQESMSCRQTPGGDMMVIKNFSNRSYISSFHFLLVLGSTIVNCRMFCKSYLVIVYPEKSTCLNLQQRCRMKTCVYGGGVGGN